MKTIQMFEAPFEMVGIGWNLEHQNHIIKPENFPLEFFDFQVQRLQGFCKQHTVNGHILANKIDILFPK